MIDTIDYKELAKLGVYGFEVHWKVNFTWSGVATCITEDDAIAFGRMMTEAADELHLQYEITVRERFEKKWIHSWDSSKERVADPRHRVFISMGGTDCDGISWRNYRSFVTLEEAAEYVDETLSSADGPTSYSTMGCEDYEMAGYPLFRDPYAEAMGY